MSYQEWRCARPKLNKTDTARRLGIDEPGRSVWHSVADGGSAHEEIDATSGRSSCDDAVRYATALC